MMASGGETSIHAPDPEIELEFGLADLGKIRNLVRRAALNAGFPSEKADELVLAVNEVTTNAVVHGRPPAVLRVWTSAEEAFCEVSDAGPGIDDMRAGQVLPPPKSIGGRGLYLARVLADDVEIRSNGNSVVSLHMAAEPPSGV
jgi:anti-sigma regulatory factor (Ser/Thr protein kinase)